MHRARFLANILMGLMGMVTAMVVMAVSVGAAITATDSAIPEQLTTKEATQAAVKVEYYLPYPGILPDSPLYKIKMIRDRIKLWMTFDESKKAAMELSLADKRINAALALAQGNKSGLAMTTATKAEKYLEQSTNRVIKLIKLGKDEKSLLLTLSKAISKHGEILLEVGQPDNASWGQTIQLNALLEQQVGQLKIEVIK